MEIGTMNIKKYLFPLLCFLSFTAAGQNLRRETQRDIARALSLELRPSTVIPNWTGKTNVFAGDSYVVGIGAGSGSLRYSSLVCAWTGATESNLGVSGEVITKAIANIAGCGSSRPIFYVNSLPAYNPATHGYLFIHLAFNDCYTNDGVHSVPDSFSYSFRQDLDSIINIKGWPAGKIVIDGLSYQRNAQGYVGVCSVTTPASAARVKQYQDSTRKFCQDYGTIYHDVYQFMLESGNPDSLIFTDGIHWDTAGHNYQARRKVDSNNYIPFFDSAVINYMQFLPAMTIADAINLNNFVITMKTNGFWPNIVGAYPNYGLWQQYGQLALVGPNLIGRGCGNFNGGFVGCPGANFGMDTQQSPNSIGSSGLTLFVSIGTNVQEVKFDFGTITGSFSNEFTVLLRDNSNVATIHAGGITATFSNSNSIGVYGFSCGTTALNCYKAGSSVASASGTATFTNTGDFYEGNADTGVNPGSKAIRMCLIIKGALTAGQIATISTAIQTLETAWGR